MDKKLAALVGNVTKSILETRGESSTEERRRAQQGEGATPEETALLRKVVAEAHTITDEDVAAAKAAGAGDDRLFELILGAALGASLHRLDKGLQALRGGADEAAQGR